MPREQSNNRGNYAFRCAELEAPGARTPRISFAPMRAKVRRFDWRQGVFANAVAICAHDTRTALLRRRQRTWLASMQHQRRDFSVAMTCAPRCRSSHAARQRTTVSRCTADCLGQSSQTACTVAALFRLSITLCCARKCGSWSIQLVVE
jgi:hypothetical protein